MAELFSAAPPFVFYNVVMNTSDYVLEYLGSQRNNPLDSSLTFDICHDYFLGCIGTASSNNRMRESVLVLWGFLGSWGMLRGSSYLHKLNPFFLREVIKVIDKYDVLFKVDVPNYDEHNENLSECFHAIYEALKWKNKKPTLTLITKIMFGVYSCIPAIDTNVSESLSGYYGSHPRAFKSILKATKLCYAQNRERFSVREITTINWEGKKYKRIFNTARLIDIYAFVNGKKQIEQKNSEKNNARGH